MLKQRAVSASIWSLLDVLGRQGLTFLTTYFLARLLTPEDFGSVTLLAVIAALAGIFVDGGFSYALIQRQDTTHDDESSVFWVNLCMAAALFVLLWWAAPWVVRFLGIPAMEPLVLPFAATIVVGAASSVHLALLTKRLAFRTLGIVNALAAGLSGLLAVGLAIAGWGVWALAVQALSLAVMTTLGLWALSGWRPRAVCRASSLRRLFAFGSYMFLSTLLDKVAYGVQSTLIGRLYGPRDVGLYSKAEGILNFPQSLVMGLVNRVAFPLFASIADDRVRMLRGVRKAIRIAMLVNAPMMLGLMATSDVVIRVLLGDQWAGASLILSVLCLVGLMWPLHVVTLTVLSGLGRSDLFFRVEVFKKVLTVPLLLVASHFGVIWVAGAQVVLVACATGVTLALSRQLIGYRIRDMVLDCLGPVLAAAGMALAVGWLGTQLAVAPVPKLGMLVLAGGVLFVVVGLLSRLTAFSEARELLLSHRGTPS